ncbi:MAG: NPCBM/NEW2 domain-containing protein [Planctomycetota bacterium]|nr:NPCBM/NEW2 domain-containing protein [Planctomycetota bacterium]
MRTRVVTVILALLAALVGALLWNWYSSAQARCRDEAHRRGKEALVARIEQLEAEKKTLSAALQPMNPGPRKRPQNPEFIYLTDLPETDVRTGYNTPLGKNGEVGVYYLQVKPKHAGAGHALSAHGPSHVAYHLLRQFKTFVATASMNMSSELPQIFRVKLDGKTVWQSAPMQNEVHIAECVVDVTGKEKLELETDPGGGAAHTVWLEPRLVPIDGFNVDRDLPVLIPAQLTFDEISGRTFVFSVKHGALLCAALTLHPSGRLVGHAHENEATWEIDPEGRLLIKGTNGLTTCRFDRMLKWGSCCHLEGRFHQTTAVHCLDNFPQYTEAGLPTTPTAPNF